MFPAAAAKSLQSCPTLCDPREGSPPGFPVPGILQARTLECVAISFSNAWKWKVKVKVKSCPTLATPCTAAYQAPLSMGFSRQEYWSGLSLPSPKGIWMRQITSSHGEDGGLEGVRCIWAGSWLSICSSDRAGRRGMEKRTLCTERKGWERLEKAREAWKPVVKTGCPAWQWSAEWKVARRLGQSWDKLHINWEPLGS